MQDKCCGMGKGAPVRATNKPMPWRKDFNSLRIGVMHDCSGDVECRSVTKAGRKHCALPSHAMACNTNSMRQVNIFEHWIRARKRCCFGPFNGEQLLLVVVAEPTRIQREVVFIVFATSVAGAVGDDDVAEAIQALKQRLIVHSWNPRAVAVGVCN